VPEFGDRLRRLRNNRPQREVANELGMPVTTLSTLENQDGVPRGPVLRKLGEYYGVPPTYFYPGGPTVMKPSESAREWLALVRQSAAKDTIATYAPPEFPDDIKKALAEKIRRRKHANASDVK
jgi:transcriptional regulator with XRE-family HTH domain